MFDVAIIGCGITGAATAFMLSKYKLNLVVLEKENDVACGASKANSGIIHGCYDPEPGTLKAKLNREGVPLLYAAADELSVPYRRNGSFVCAFGAEEEKTLQKLYARGLANGIEQLSLISGDEARALEPALSPDITLVLNVPTAGIVSPYQLTVAAIGNAMDNGAELLREFAVTAIDTDQNGVTVTADENGLTATVNNVLEDGSVEVVDTFSKVRSVCADGAHLFRLGVNTNYLVCDHCNAKTKLSDLVGMIAVNDNLMYYTGKGFRSGWIEYNGKTYYMDTTYYTAVDGVRRIGSYTYVFENHVLVEGAWVNYGEYKKLAWGGKYLTSTWHTQAGKTYYLLENGAAAVGTVEITETNENGETVTETYIFDEDGALIGKA